MPPLYRVHPFVGGALAVIGCGGAEWVIYGVSLREPMGLIVAYGFVSFALPLGLLVLWGNARGIWLTYLYLWIAMLLQGGFLLAVLLHLLPSDGPRVGFWDPLKSFLGTLALFVLFTLGKSKCRCD
jgi:hypothetical protein